MIAQKAATVQSRHSRPSFFYSSAREGFEDFLANTITPDRSKVLLPSFVGWSPREGSGVFDPIRRLSLTAEFYNLNHDLTADVQDISRRLERGDFRTLVLIHYYGRTDPRSSAIRDLAAKHDVLLVEDLAHGFFSAAYGGKAGRFGAVSLYSIHKMLPIASGGVVVYANDSLVRNQRSTMPALAGSVFSYDWRAISDARRENFVHATTLLERSTYGFGKVELLWPHLDVGDVPQTLPLYILSANRDQIYERMNAMGVGVVSLYHTLIPEIGDEYTESIWAAARILNLPVHQDLSPDSIREVVRVLEECLTDPRDEGE